MSKSYWGGVCCKTAKDKAAILSRLSPIGDEMEPQKAEVLSDTATDRTKKIRVHLRDKNGRLLVATRTFGKTYSIKLTPLKTAE